MRLYSLHPQPATRLDGQNHLVQSPAKAATRFGNRRSQTGYLSTVNWVTINVPVLTAVVFR